MPKLSPVRRTQPLHWIAVASVALFATSTAQAQVEEIGLGAVYGSGGWSFIIEIEGGFLDSFAVDIPGPAARTVVVDPQETTAFDLSYADPMGSLRDPRRTLLPQPARRL